MSIPGKSKGFVQVTGPLQTVEHETFTCQHCNRLVIVPHRAAPEDCGGFCLKCMQPICKACAKTGRCTPFEQKIEAYEKRQRMLAQI